MPNPIAVETKTGRVWRVRFRHEGASTSRTFERKPAAQAFCDDIDDVDADYALKRLEGNEIGAHDMPTLTNVAGKFFERKATRVSEGTLYDYRKMFENRIEPTFGRRPITAITQADVQAWVEALIEDGMKPKSIVNVHGLMHSILGFAASANGLSLPVENACAETDLPKREQKPKRDLRVSDWIALRDGLFQVDRDGAELAEFMVMTGFRFSEATALDGFHVDTTEDGTMYVTMANVRRKTTPGHFEIVQQSGKGQSSLRTIALDAATADLVRARQARMSNPNGLIFTTKTGAAWLNSNFHARIWKPALGIAGLLDRTPAVRVHDLRHTHLTWLAQSPEANIAQVSGRAGHSTLDITIKTYARGIRDVQSSALSAIAAQVYREPKHIEATAETVKGEVISA